MEIAARSQPRVDTYSHDTVRTVAVSSIFPCRFPAGLLCRRVHDDPGQVQNLACEVNSAGKCADAACDDDGEYGVRASAHTPLPVSGSRCFVDEYRRRTFEAPRGFKDGSEGVDRELLSTVMPSSG